MRLGVSRIELDRSVVRSPRVIQPAQITTNSAELKVCFRKRGTNVDCPLVTCDRIGELSRGMLGSCEVEVDCCVVFCSGSGSSEHSNRQIGAIILPCKQAKLMQGGDVARCMHQNFLQDRLGTINIAARTDWRACCRSDLRLNVAVTGVVFRCSISSRGLGPV